MNAIQGLAYGFSIGLDPVNILAVLAGVVLGTVIGVLPGIGPMGSMAILLPVTIALRPDTAVIMLAGIYYGSMYGGSTTSILLNIPGEATSVVTCIDGYQMAKKGRAGSALAVAGVGSFVAGTLGVVGLMLFAPTLANAALSFGPPEFFAIALLGLIALSRISGGPFWQNLLVLALGIVVSTIGLDELSGVARYTFGLVQLTQGIELVPVVMGLYGITEVLSVVEKAGGLPQIRQVKFRQLFPTCSEWRRALPAMLRGSLIGFLWGLIPGPATVLSTFGSYSIERRLSKHPQEFGQGAIEGVAGPESANNGAASSAMIPMLSLGIPFAPATAMLLAALLLHGVQTGPLLIAEKPEVFWGVVASMYIGNLVLLLLNFPFVGIWVSLLRIPQSMLVIIVLLLTMVGAYSINNSVFDLVVMVVAGIVGYVFRKLRFDMAPLVLALVLGGMLEATLRQSLIMSAGNPLIFFQRPISGFFMSVLLIMIVVPSIWHPVTKHRRKTTDLTSIAR